MALANPDAGVLPRTLDFARSSRKDEITSSGKFGVEWKGMDESDIEQFARESCSLDGKVCLCMSLRKYV